MVFIFLQHPLGHFEVKLNYGMRSNGRAFTETSMDWLAFRLNSWAISPKNVKCWGIRRNILRIHLFENHVSWNHNGHVEMHCHVIIFRFIVWWVFQRGMHLKIRCCNNTSLINKRGPTFSRCPKFVWKCSGWPCKCCSKRANFFYFLIL